MPKMHPVGRAETAASANREAGIVTFYSCLSQKPCPLAMPPRPAARSEIDTSGIGLLFM